MRQRRRFSALTQRVLAVNLLALGIVVGGVVYLDQYQRGLIEGQIESLTTQAQIIAAALGETVIPRDPTLPQRINLGRATEVIIPLILPVASRARLFRNDGALLIDSRSTAHVAMRELPSPESSGAAEALVRRFNEFLDHLLIGELPPQIEVNVLRAEYFSEVRTALAGGVEAQARRDADGSLVLNVAVPVSRYKEVLGALMLTADALHIEGKVREVRSDVLMLGAGVLGLTILLSFYLAGTVTGPVRQLAAAAERVTTERGAPDEIPDFSGRADEIGDLSVALRSMTEELHARLNEIASFAADVAHELKNPLSSLRSAIEILPRMEEPGARQRLLDVLTHDITRMDRLISDISAASRLDAQLKQAITAPVDMKALLETLVAVQRTRVGDDGVEIVFDNAMSEGDRPGAATVRGIEDRLAQVFVNLIDNAVSFSPLGGTIRVCLASELRGVRVTVEDDGPGLPPGKVNAIFNRFYSERPSGEAFGMHSGLGLSIVKRIVEAHGGRVRAENRGGAAPGEVAGARFTVWLPR